MTEIAFNVEFICRLCNLRRCSGGASSAAITDGVCECDYAALLPSIATSTYLAPSRFILKTNTGLIIGGEEGDPILDMSQACRMAYRIAIHFACTVNVFDAATGCRVDSVGPKGRFASTAA